MPFNLLLDPFFPVLTRAGRRRWVAFPGLAEGGDDEPVEFDWPRADFNIAALELAIGVALMAFQPQKPSEWRRLWDKPPSPDEVAEAIAPFTHAFALDGEGPRFLQELGGLTGETTAIEALLIDTPGFNGQKKNADLLTHRDRYRALGLPAAAMALYALQQFAPSGGAGNRTSMRGGGPMSTFVVPGGLSLWRTLVANLPEPGKYLFETEDLPKILPWLAPTLVSDKGQVLADGDPKAHSLQAFFGMPRRIALRFAGIGPCAMTGESGPQVEGFMQKPWGVNYGVWTHPLTPYRRQKEGAQPYSVKPKSARFGYRDWTPVALAAAKGVLAEPAPAVALARATRRKVLRSQTGAAALRAAGWAMNNMEAVAYLSAEQPLHLVQSEEAQVALDADAWRFAHAGDAVAAALVQGLKAALFSQGAKPATDGVLFNQVRSGFYDATEAPFHALLDARLATPLAPSEAQAREWLAILRRAAFAAFQSGAPLPLDQPERARPIANASKTLGLTLAGYGKAGRALFETLELAPPETAAAKKGKQHES